MYLTLLAHSQIFWIAIVLPALCVAAVVILAAVISLMLRGPAQNFEDDTAALLKVDKVTLVPSHTFEERQQGNVTSEVTSQGPVALGERLKRWFTDAAFLTVDGRIIVYGSTHQIDPEVHPLERDYEWCTKLWKSGLAPKVFELSGRRTYIHSSFTTLTDCFYVMDASAGRSLANLVFEAKAFDRDEVKGILARFIIKLRDLHRMGITHKSICAKSLLVNNELHKIVFADFSKAQANASFEDMRADLQAVLNVVSELYGLSHFDGPRRGLVFLANGELDYEAIAANI
jgi:predicted Ser/Thr protein kinase